MITIITQEEVNTLKNKALYYANRFLGDESQFVDVDVMGESIDKNKFSCVLQYYRNGNPVGCDQCLIRKDKSGESYNLYIASALNHDISKNNCKYYKTFTI